MHKIIVTGRALQNRSNMMKWVYRILVLVTALAIFGVTYYVNIKGIHRGSPALAPFAPFMTSGMFVLGMRMITENIESYIWKIIMVSIPLFFAVGIALS